jgi:hypothetical protein
MEPQELNRSDDVQLEALLRSRATPLRDDGFSARVIAALPRRRASHTMIFVALGALAGVGVATMQLLRTKDTTTAWTEVAHGFTALADPWVMSALVVAGVAAAYALRPGHGSPRPE